MVLVCLGRGGSKRVSYQSLSRQRAMHAHAESRVATRFQSKTLGVRAQSCFEGSRALRWSSADSAAHALEWGDSRLNGEGLSRTGYVDTCDDSAIYPWGRC